MEFHEFYEKWNKIWLKEDQNKDQRVGQSAFNRLVEHNPVLAKSLRGTLLDPFYQNSNLEKFWKHVAEHWNDLEQNKL